MPNDWSGPTGSRSRPCGAGARRGGRRRHRRGQDRAVPGPGRGAGRRDREHRRDAGLPGHGHRHGEAAGRGAPRDPAPPAGPARRHGAGDGGAVPGPGPRRGRGLPGSGARCRSWSAARRSTPAPCSTASSSPAPTPTCGPASRPSWTRSGPASCTGGWPRSTPRPPPGSSPPTAAAWCGRWRSSRSPAGRSARRCRTRRTSWSAPCRSASGSRGRSWTSGSSCGCAGCGTSGLVEEVRRLAGAGLREGRTAHRALGYQQVLAFLDGECSEQEALRADRVRHPALRPAAGLVVPQGPADRLGGLGRPRPGPARRSAVVEADAARGRSRLRPLASGKEHPHAPHTCEPVRGSRSRRSHGGRRSRRRPAVGLGRRRRPVLHQDAHQPRLRRRGHLGRPGGVPDRPAGAEERRQRGRRGGRDGGGARRDRALQLRPRRWRLLRLLRREDRKVHTIDGRETAPRLDAPRRVHRQVHRQALQLHPRAGHQRRVRRRPRHPGHLGQGAARVGHLPARRARSPRPSGWPAAASSSTRPSTSRPWTTSSGSRPTPPPRGCSCPAAPPRGPGRSSATPRWPTPTARSGRKGVSWFYRGPIAERDRRATCRRRRRARPPTCPCRPATSPAATWPATARCSARPTHASYRGYGVYGMGGSSSRRHHRRRGAEHHGAVPAAPAEHRPAAAPLPRGQRAGVRRPGEVPRRPGLRRRPARHPALRPVRRRRGPARSA